MKHIAVVLVLILLFGCHMNNDPEGSHTMQDHLPHFDTSDLTNDFFDNVVTHKLPLRDIRIDGEIHNPGRAEFQDLTLRSVIVKETRINDEGNKFIGAYRYDGYSLYDLLNRIRINKLNREEFSPIIDLYVIISNNQAEILLINRDEDQQGGKFSIFPAADFFSDRAVKAINEIYVDFIDE